MSNREVVVVSGLTFEYPGVRALDDVTFSVPWGSVTALVGPNGAGKTTLLRCMAALEQPLDGTIKIDGIDALEQPRECHRRIGYLSDFFGLYDSLTVKQCLTHAGSAQGMAEHQVPGAVERTAEDLGLTEKLDSLCSGLSRGQRQRLAIGQALIHSPKLLILDEPASGLDPEARHELAGLFLKLRDQGMSLIVSSHILAELDEYSTHMLVMKGGRIVENRALSVEKGSAGVVRMRVEIAGGGVLDEILRAVTTPVQGVSLLENSGISADFSVADNAEAKAQLLRTLVESGIAVVGYAQERENLHDSYLRTVQKIASRSAP